MTRDYRNLARLTRRRCQGDLRGAGVWRNGDIDWLASSDVDASLEGRQPGDGIGDQHGKGWRQREARVVQVEPQRDGAMPVALRCENDRRGARGEDDVVRSRHRRACDREYRRLAHVDAGRKRMLRPAHCQQRGRRCRRHRGDDQRISRQLVINTRLAHCDVDIVPHRIVGRGKTAGGIARQSAQCNRRVDRQRCVQRAAVGRCDPHTDRIG